MIIKRIEMKNIRSYSEASLDVPMGKTLFEGDIGTGKSSILMAIEFAFFGLGSETGGSLLRMGEKEGSVRLTFEVDGREYWIERRLQKRGQRVQQTEGRIGTPDGETDLSPTELKEKVLEILRFNEAPDPKARSRIYRYSVYTPQEDMKSILVMAPEDRLQILRRAFGIEDYRIAAANSDDLARGIRTRVKELRAASADLQNLRLRHEAERKSVDVLRAKVRASLDEEAMLSSELDEVEDERGKLRKDEVRMASLSKEVALHEKAVARLKEELDDVGEETKRTERRLLGLESGGGEPTPPTGGKPRTELEREVAELEQKTKAAEIRRDRAGQKVEEYHSIAVGGVCPLCDRAVREGEFAEKEESKRTEMEHVEEELKQYEIRLTETKRLLAAEIEYESAQLNFALRRETIDEEGRRLSRLREKSANLAGECEEVSLALERGRSEWDALKGSSERLKRVERTAEDLQRQLTRVRETAASAKTRAEDKERSLAELEEAIKHAEEASDKAHRLDENQIWLEGYFAPTVSAMEKQVMASLNQEFDSAFKRWFAMLVGDPQKEVRIDESFTPTVTQDGYEQATEYLSGGERTGVALAYRLALNTLVQQVSTGMKSNILILDEPTDGFSKEQLGSVREVLDDVGCPQMVIVSHEKELESFADQIFRVTKSQGESHVESAPV
jgi:exonuclease SbcC